MPSFDAGQTGITQEVCSGCPLKLDAGSITEIEALKESVLWDLQSLGDMQWRQLTYHDKDRLLRVMCAMLGLFRSDD